MYLLTSIDWHIELSSEVDEERDRGREGSLRETYDMFVLWVGMSRTRPLTSHVDCKMRTSKKAHIREAASQFRFPFVLSALDLPPSHLGPDPFSK